MLSFCSHSQPGIPNNADPFPGTTKQLHQYLMPSLIIVTLHIPIYGMHELLEVHKIFFAVYWIFSAHLHWYTERPFFTFWWALSFHHYICLFYICMYLFFNCFSLLILQLLPIWHYGNLPHQTPVWPTLFLPHLRICNEVLLILFFCHVLTSVHSGFWIITQSWSLSHMLNSSWNGLDIFLAHVCSCSICNCYTFLFCLSLFFCSCFLVA